MTEPSPSGGEVGPAGSDEAAPRIHFSRWTSWNGSKARGEANQILWFGGLSIAAVGGFLALAIARVLIVPGWVWGVVTLAVIALVVGVCVRAIMRARRRLLTEQTLWRRPDPACRIRCVGTPEELLAFGPLDPALFEPECFSPLVGAARGVAQGWCVALVMLGVAGAAALGQWVTPVRVHVPWTFVFWGGLVAGYAAASWLWPTYYRVVPGRVEILRFAFRMNRTPAVERWDLRRARLLVDLRRWLVRIEDAGTTRDFTIRFVPGRRRMAYYLLLAAVAREQAPELPDDALLG